MIKYAIEPVGTLQISEAKGYLTRALKKTGIKTGNAYIDTHSDSTYILAYLFNANNYFAGREDVASPKGRLKLKSFRSGLPWPIPIDGVHFFGGTMWTYFRDRSERAMLEPAFNATDMMDIIGQYQLDL